MKILIGIIFTVIGLIPLIYWTIRENVRTSVKIISAALCGAFVFGGLVITFII